MKSIFRSKTFWANAVSILALVGTASGHPAAVLLSDPATQAQAVGVVTAIVNVALRLITKEPVTVLPR